MKPLAFLLCPALLAQAPEDAAQAARVSAVIKVLATRDPARIAAMVRYPLPRPYPLPSIRSARECRQRFAEVFDEDLLARAGASNAVKDWSRVGWRGVMFGNGELWLDDEGRIIAVNRDTQAGKAALAAAVARDKAGLPPDLRDFDRPQLKWSTARHVIRVDGKGDTYRLVLLDRAGKKVQLVLEGGVWSNMGNMGSYAIDWVSGGRTHRILGADRTGGRDCYQIFSSVIEHEDWNATPIMLERRIK